MTAYTKTSFTLEAGPGTDIWKKPPVKNIWNAPISHTTSGPLKKFRSARATFWADWTERYDQGGLLLVPRRASSPSPSPSSIPDKWIKTGVELYRGKPQLSTVGTDRFADWSVSPITTTTTATAAAADPAKGGGGGTVTVEIAREGDEHGRSAWVYQLVLNGSGEGREVQEEERIPLREICWLFADEDEDEGAGDEWVLDVSPLVARPEKTATEPLKVRFEEFKVEWLP